jgi:hypothetical protein
MEMIGKAAYKIKIGLQRDCLYKDTSEMLCLCYAFIELLKYVMKEVHQ